MSMENKYILAALTAIALGALTIGAASAHSNNRNQKGAMMGDDNVGMSGMMGMMSMMQGNFVHDKADIDWMKKEMKEHVNLTDEEVDEMSEQCPMMRRR